MNGDVLGLIDSYMVHFINCCTSTSRLQWSPSPQPELQGLGVMMSILRSLTRMGSSSMCVGFELELSEV